MSCCSPPIPIAIPKTQVSGGQLIVYELMVSSLDTSKVNVCPNLVPNTDDKVVFDTSTPPIVTMMSPERIQAWLAKPVSSIAEINAGCSSMVPCNSHCSCKNPYVGMR
jgi:hypothetical protein